MVRKKGKRHNSEVDYWQPTTDMLISLLLILLLVILLLGLYLLHKPENIRPGYDDRAEEASTEYDGKEDHKEDHQFDYKEPDHEDDDDDDNGGDNKGDDKGDQPGEFPDEGVKSAVHVTLIDAETKLAVKEPGVTFELYSNKDGLQSLNTYYPEKVTYREYATTEDGTFYLPEKIYQGGYYFHDLTEPAGYDLAANKKFRIKKLYDWPKPYEVQIPIYPSRNIVSVQLNDKDTGLAVTGASFHVIAAQDIITADGTVRFKAGDVADEIVLNEEGYGESQPLYLGQYYLKENVIPEFYSGVMENVDVQVNKKSETPADPNTVQTEKTRIGIRVADELYPDQVLEGISYEVSCDGQPVQTYTTDRKGSILLEDLQKGVTYHIKQATQLNDYLIDPETHDVPVDANGLINSQTSTELELTNRMLRVTISLTDALIGSQVSDVNLAIYDSNDQVVKTWTTTGVSVTLTDLPAGNYQIVRDGDKSKSYLLTVENTAKPQKLNITIFTWRSAVVIGVGILILIIVVAGLRVIFGMMAKRRKQKKPKEIVQDSSAEDPFREKEE